MGVLKIVIVMENKLTWDYLGCHEFVNHGFFNLQNDWNQTLITKINQLSAQIHKSTLRGGANVIKMHPRFLPLFDTLEYFKVLKSGKMMLTSKYEIILDENIEENVLFVSHNDEELNTLEEQDLVMFVKKYGMENSLSILKKDSYDYNLALSDPNCSIINEDKLKGEIEILNYE